MVCAGLPFGFGFCEFQRGGRCRLDAASDDAGMPSVEVRFDERMSNAVHSQGMDTRF